MEHEDLDTLLEQLIAAYETNDRDTAANAFEEFAERLAAHFAGEEELLFPDFARTQPDEANLLREDHRRIRSRIDELGIGVDLHQTRIGAIRELAQMLRAHAARENELLYRWSERAFSDPTRRPDLHTLFAHGRSPAAPVQS